MRCVRRLNFVAFFLIGIFLAYQRGFAQANDPYIIVGAIDTVEINEQGLLFVQSFPQGRGDGMVCLYLLKRDSPHYAAFSQAIQKAYDNQATLEVRFTAISDDPESHLALKKVVDSLSPIQAPGQKPSHHPPVDFSNVARITSLQVGRINKPTEPSPIQAPKTSTATKLPKEFLEITGGGQLPEVSSL